MRARRTRSSVTAPLLTFVAATAAVVATVAVPGTDLLRPEGAPRSVSALSEAALPQPVAATTRPRGDRQRRDGRRLRWATTYYVSPTGSDAANGTSSRSPVATLARASQLPLKAGDRLLLARGGSWTGTLRLAASGTSRAPITVGAYGTGALPRLAGSSGSCVDVTGARVAVADLHVDGCAWAGVRVAGDDVRVERVLATGSWAGIQVDTGADRAKVLRNEVRDNDRMAPGTDGPDDDYGAFGILVNGDGAEIAWNTITGQEAISPDYGSDGSAVEVYGAIGTRVHHNRAFGNRAFTELGHARTADTVYAYNVSVSDVPYAEFLVTRGSGNHFGPVVGTVAVHNSVLHTGRGAQGFWCGGTCSPAVLTLVGNVLHVAGRAGWSDVGAVGSSDNVFWGGALEVPLGPGDRYADPRFTSPTTGDLALGAGSPAVDRAGLGTAGWGVDAQGRSTPRDGDGDGVALADVGALER